MKVFLERFGEKIYLLFLVVVSGVLRFVNLGYSEFQGDEIRILYRTSQPFLEFLLSQKKGPIQFIVAYSVGLVDRGHSELLTRLPFAVAGTFAVAVFYLLVKTLFGRRTAAVASMLFSVNGLFVAFSRIAQYQSFTLLFFLLGLYFLVRLSKELTARFLYLASLMMSLAVLSHYDTLFLVPTAVYFIFVWVRRTGLAKSLTHVALSLLLFLLITGAFYIPFIMSSHFSSNTTPYLLGRISGEDGGNKKTDTFITYAVYNPFVSLPFLLLFLLAAFFKDRKTTLIFLLWFVPSFVILNFLASIPGTHIYNYVIPAIVFSSVGVVRVYDFLKRIVLRRVFAAAVSLVFIFLFYQSFLIFVDNTTEYPWYPKRVLLWDASLPSTKYHLSLFGFPYNRNLREVDVLVTSLGNQASISSNEGSKLIRYYISSPAGLPVGIKRVYIYVYGSQSLVRKRSSKVSGIIPAASYFRGETPLTDVYFY